MDLKIGQSIKDTEKFLITNKAERIENTNDYKIEQRLKNGDKYKIISLSYENEKIEMINLSDFDRLDDAKVKKAKDDANKKRKSINKLINKKIEEDSLIRRLKKMYI